VLTMYTTFSSMCRCKCFVFPFNIQLYVTFNFFVHFRHCQLETLSLFSKHLIHANMHNYDAKTNK